MSDNLQQKIRKIAEDIFEITCYMFPLDPMEMEDVLEDNMGISEEPVISAMVTFKGAAKGVMVISVDNRLFEAIAANMLGVDEVLNEEKEVALCEIANIICGNTVPLFAKNSNICFIDLPRIRKSSDHLEIDYRNFNCTSFTVYLDEGVSKISIFYKQEV